MKQGTWIFGLGSPHGDDQIGWLAATRLHAECLPNFIPVSDSSRLLDLLPRCRKAILIDACVAGKPAGSITRMVWPDPRIEVQHSHSTHGMSAAAALQMAEKLGRLPETVVLFGVEIVQSLPGSTASPEVRGAIPELAAGILEELRCERVLASGRVMETPLP